MCKTEKETYKSFRTLLEMRNWGNMSTTAHGTPQSRWRCEENLFEGTGAFSSTVCSRQAHHLHVLLACSLAPGKRDPLLSQVESLLLRSSSTSQEQTLGRTRSQEQEQQRMGAGCLWAALGGETAGTFLTLGAGSLAALCST